jgi:hypothetical protein
MCLFFFFGGLFWHLNTVQIWSRIQKPYPGDLWTPKIRTPNIVYSVGGYLICYEGSGLLCIVVPRFLQLPASPLEHLQVQRIPGQAGVKIINLSTNINSLKNW